MSENNAFLICASKSSIVTILQICRTAVLSLNQSFLYKNVQELLIYFNTLFHKTIVFGPFLELWNAQISITLQWDYIETVIYKEENGNRRISLSPLPLPCKNNHHMYTK